MATQLGTMLFVDDLPKYINMLNQWLDGDIIDDMKNDDGESFFVTYNYDGVVLSIFRPSEETTQTPTKTNGSTNVVQLLVDSKEKVNTLHSKAIELGFTTMSTDGPDHTDKEDSSSMYMSVVQDPALQYWHLMYKTS